MRQLHTRHTLHYCQSCVSGLGWVEEVTSWGRLTRAARLILRAGIASATLGSEDGGGSEDRRPYREEK